MRRFSVVLSLLFCTAANAQIYKCPDTYPVGSKGARLSSARMHFGERQGGGALHGDIAELKDGTDIHYDFPDEMSRRGMPRWLVCQYGGKRIDGTAISTAQVIGGQDWWVQLDPLVDVCDLKIRESRQGGASAGIRWAAAACRRKEPPPPVMME
jgi:hypothetical protein